MRQIPVHILAHVLCELFMILHNLHSLPSYVSNVAMLHKSHQFAAGSIEIYVICRRCVTAPVEISCWHSAWNSWDEDCWHAPTTSSLFPLIVTPNLLHFQVFWTITRLNMALKTQNNARPSTLFMRQESQWRTHSREDGNHIIDLHIEMSFRNRSWTFPQRKSWRKPLTNLIPSRHCPMRYLRRNKSIKMRFYGYQNECGILYIFSKSIHNDSRSECGADCLCSSALCPLFALEVACLGLRSTEIVLPLIFLFFFLCRSLLFLEERLPAFFEAAPWMTGHHPPNRCGSTSVCAISMSVRSIQSELCFLCDVDGGKWSDSNDHIEYRQMDVVRWNVWRFN